MYDDEPGMYSFPGIYHPRRRDPKVIRRAHAVARIRELIEEEIADLPFVERIKFRFSLRFGHPVRGEPLTRLKDRISQWYAWNIAGRRDALPLLGRLIAACKKQGVDLRKNA